MNITFPELTFEAITPAENAMNTIRASEKYRLRLTRRAIREGLPHNHRAWQVVDRMSSIESQIRHAISCESHAALETAQKAAGSAIIDASSQILMLDFPTSV